MHWSLPRTSDAHVLAVCGSLLALLHLVTFQGLAGEFSVAELTFVRQFGDCLLDGQIAGGRALWDFHATVRTGGRLIAKSREGKILIKISGHRNKFYPILNVPSICQEMSEAGCTHKMAHLTLKIERRGIRFDLWICKGLEAEREL